jgi:hypothetical protein
MQIKDLLTRMQDAFDQTAKRLEASNKAHAAERREFLAALDQDAVRNLLTQDRELQKQIDSARAALKAEEKQARQAEKTLETISAAALAQVKKWQRQRVDR